MIDFCRIGHGYGIPFIFCTARPAYPVYIILVNKGDVKIDNMAYHADI